MGLKTLMLVDREFGSVRTGAAGAGVAGMPSPARTSVPFAFGYTNTSCPKPGVAPSTELMVAPIMRS